MDKINECRGCKWFVPNRFSIGTCNRQFSAGTKMWAEDGKQINVHVTFVCDEFRVPDDLKVEMV